MKLAIATAAILTGMVFFGHSETVTELSAVPCMRGDGILMSCDSDKWASAGGTYRTDLQYTTPMSMLPVKPAPPKEPEAPDEEPLDLKTEAPKQEVVIPEPDAIVIYGPQTGNITVSN